MLSAACARSGNSHVAEQSRFFQWYHAIAASSLSTSEKCVAVVGVGNHMDAEGYAWPSVDRIAANVSMKQRQVRRILHTLEAAGWLEVHRMPGRVNSYQATVPSRIDPTAGDGDNGAESGASRDAPLEKAAAHVAVLSRVTGYPCHPQPMNGLRNVMANSDDS
jgi:hypothetical protein